MVLMAFKLFFADFTKILLLDYFLVKSAKNPVQALLNTQKTQNKKGALNFKIGALFSLHPIFISTLRLQKV